MSTHKAQDGKVFINNVTGTVTGNKIILGVNDDISNYNEIDELLVHMSEYDKVQMIEILEEEKMVLENDLEATLTQAKNGLVSLPTPDAPWDSAKNYIQGDTVTYDSIVYVALRYSRNKNPQEYLDFWGIQPTEIESYAEWTSFDDGHVFYEDDKVTLDGKNWNCIMQHMKSTVYKPKAGSSRWQEI